MKFMFSMTKEMHTKLFEYANERGISVSAIVKLALVKFFKGEE